MFNPVQDSIGGLVSYLVAFGAGGITKATVDYFRKQAPLRRLWGLERGSEILVVLSEIPRNDPGHTEITTGLGEIEAYEAVTRSLARAYGASNPVKSLFCGSFAWGFHAQTKAHIVSIGGPKYNKLTEGTSGRVPEVPFKLHKQEDGEWVVLDTRTRSGVVHRSIKQSNEIMIDYGLISRLPRGDSPDEGVILLIEGIHTFGVAGAGKALTGKHASDLAKEIKKHRCRYWQALIETEVRGGQAPAPRPQGKGASCFVPLTELHLKRREKA